MFNILDSIPQRHAGQNQHIMPKTINPKITAILIITLIIAGTVCYVNYLINKPLKILKNYTIPKEFIFNDTKIALAWTDENEGETLIIQSDKKEYNGFSSVDVYFSITNISKKDQDMDVVVWVGNEKVKVEEISKIDDDDNFHPSSEHKQFSIFTRQASTSNFQTISNELMNKFSNRKDVNNFKTGYSVNDNINSGNTNYYKATIKYPPMSKGEFFIEAFGSSFVISNKAERREKSLERGKTANSKNKTFKGFLANARNDKMAYGHLDPWYSSNWSYKREITINSNQIATTTSNFPVLATTTLDDLKTTTNGGKVGNDNGYDIIFVDDDDSTLLNFEREKYASTTGEIVYWIKTNISSTTDKTIYMYYGNGSATDQATTTGVWDDNFVMVQHLSEIPDNTAGQIKDSTSNSNDGQTFTMASDDQVTGQIGGSLDFDGGSDYIDCGAPLIPADNNFTISAWINLIDYTTYDVVFGQYATSQSGRFVFSATQGTGVIYAYAGATIVTTPDPVGLETHHVFLTRLGNTYTIYIDGVEIISDDSVASIYQGSNTQIGVAGTINHFKGTIDEARISNIARSAGWIETEYNNQSDVDSFMTFGAAEETYKLDITTAAKVIVAGTESTAVTVQADHNVSADTTINLSSDSTGTYHFAATPGGAEVSFVTIPSGASTTDFYYTDYEAGSPMIVVAATNFVSDDQQQTVQAGPKYKIKSGGDNGIKMQGYIKFK